MASIVTSCQTIALSSIPIFTPSQLHKTLQTRRNPAIQVLHDSSMPARQLAQPSKLI